MSILIMLLAIVLGLAFFGGGDRRLLEAALENVLSPRSFLALVSG